MHIRGWAEKFIGWLWCNGPIWQHSLPCSSHTSSIGLAVLGFPWYRSSHPDPRKSPWLQIWPHHRSDTASQPSVFHVGEHKIDGAKSGEYGGWSPVQSHSHAQQPLQSQLVCRSIVLVKQDSLHQFSRLFTIYISLVLLFKVLNYLSGRKQCISIRKGWINACQVSLLWHNSFLVSLWTFQPTLVLSM